MSLPKAAFLLSDLISGIIRREIEEVGNAPAETKQGDLRGTSDRSHPYIIGARLILDDIPQIPRMHRKTGNTRGVPEPSIGR